MTREERIQQMLDDWVSVKICEKAMIDDINEIYNDFESRTCENCISYDGSHKCNNENSMAHETSNRVYPSDGCREDFERKQNEN